MLRYGSIVLIVLAVFLAVQVIYTFVLTANVGDDIYPQTTISVNGTGEVLAMPDVATFSFGAQMTGETVAEAQKVVTDRINKAIEIVKAAGVEDKDIKTIGYNINPHYEYINQPCTSFSCPGSRERLVGYDVTQTVEIKVRDTGKAGDILGKLGAVEITNVSGISFTIDKVEELQAEARAKAIANAKERAEKLADDLDVKLVRIINFYENEYPGPMYQVEGFGKGGDMAVDAPPMPQVPTGENTITSTVSIVYEIK